MDPLRRLSGRAICARRELRLHPTPAEHLRNRDVSREHLEAVLRAELRTKRYPPSPDG